MKMMQEFRSGALRTILGRYRPSSDLAITVHLGTIDTHGRCFSF